jgi:hypothetical protein
MMNWFNSIWNEQSANNETTFNHHKLGQLKYENEGWWKGQKVINEHKIEFFVDGARQEVNENLADICYDVLSGFEFYFEKALAFIQSELNISEDEVKCRFIPNSVSSFWKNQNETMFYLWFEDKNNKHTHWRVQFDNDAAKYLACDT